MLDLQRMLRDYGKELPDYGLASVPETAEPTSAVMTEVHRHDQARVLEQLQQVQGLNADQRAVYDAVLAAARDRRRNVSRNATVHAKISW